MASRGLIEVSHTDHTPAIVGRNVAMERMITQAERVARTDATVLITGETGAGKDVLARFIHAQSERATNEMVSVNCGAFPETLFDSEFFGHQKGAFTGATADRPGLLETADWSTLFLDEVGDLPPLMQVKLLRFLEDGSFRRVGSNYNKRVNVRIIAATNKDLERAVREEAFRADLYYRLNVVTLFVSPLRERREEIPELAESFLTIFRTKFRRPRLALSHDARRTLRDYNWPGNIRQLRNCVERACALAANDMIEEDDLSIAQQSKLHLVVTDDQSNVVADPRLLVGSTMTLAQLQRAHIESILAKVDGNRDRAAAILGITSRTLYRKLREYEGGAESDVEGVA